MKDCLWIYGPHNRLYYNQMTLPNVLAECSQSKRFAHLLILDDNSTDGTSEWIQSIDFNAIPGVKVTYERRAIGNSYDQWNIARAFADKIGGVRYLMNICNDLLIPHGILDESAAILDEHKDAFALGYKHDGRMFSEAIKTRFPVIGTRSIQQSSHIGAGLIRLADMELEGDIKGSTLPGEERYFGFTQYQNLLRQYHKKRMLVAKHIQVLPLDKAIDYSRNIKYRDNGVSRLVVSEQPPYTVQQYK